MHFVFRATRWAGKEEEALSHRIPALLSLLWALLSSLRYISEKKEELSSHHTLLSFSSFLSPFPSLYIHIKRKEVSMAIF